jgi:hypothetical protein
MFLNFELENPKVKYHVRHLDICGKIQLKCICVCVCVCVRERERDRDGVRWCRTDYSRWLLCTQYLFILCA